MRIRPVSDLRLGLAHVPYWQGIDGDVQKAMMQAVHVMKRVTKEVRDAQLPTLPTSSESPLPKTYSTVIFSEAYAFHREMLARHPERYHPGTRASIELGKPISAAEYIVERREMERLRATAAALVFKDFDLLITPTAPGPAFKLGSQPRLVFLRNTAPWNCYGLPPFPFPAGSVRAVCQLDCRLLGDRIMIAPCFHWRRRFNRKRTFTSFIHRSEPSVCVRTAKHQIHYP